MSRRSARWSQTAGVGAMVWGATLLAKGPELWVAVDGRSPDGPDRLAVRFLGMRHLTQGAVQALFPTRFRGLFVAVDVIHAASMFALAAADERCRRPALASGSVALATAALSLRSATAD